jgi:hypothetical protein
MRCLFPIILALVLLAGLLFPADVHAQLARRSRSGDETSGRAPPVAPYGFVIASTLAVLTIVCYPSRKG